MGPAGAILAGMEGAPRQPALARALREAYLEVFPADGIEAKLESLPAGAYLAITCSPRRGIGATLDLAERLSKRRRLRLVPHLSARLVVDERHLAEILARIEGLQVDSVFVPAGDVKEPAGSFASSLELLRAMAQIGHRIPEVGVAAHPEGHPFLGERTLASALAAKEPLATYMVTQMCFDADAIVRWLERTRAAGIRLPAWIGLPGVVERGRLFVTALRIGVGESVRFLGRQRDLALRLLARRRYRPDDLLLRLADHEHAPIHDVAGFHLYSFNQVEETERWRASMLERLAER